LVALFLSLAASVVFTSISSKLISPERIATEISSNIADEISRVDASAASFLTLYKKDPRTRFPDTEGFSFFLVTKGRIIRWSDNSFVPSPASVQDNFELKLIREGNSDYLAKKWPIDNIQSLIGIIPLSRNYNIINNYLKPEWNSDIFPVGSSITILDPAAPTGASVCYGETCPFKITADSERQPRSIGLGVVAFSMIFVSLGIFLVLFFEQVSRRLPPDFVFISMLVVFLGARVVMTRLEFPARLVNTDLFNPVVFASSSLNASLGDLLLNEILLFFICFYLFQHLFQFRSIQYLQHRSKWSRYVLSVFSSFMILLAMLFPFVVIQTLYNNSSIVLGVSESLQFSPLRIAATIIVVLSGVCSFLFAHAFIRLLIGDEDRIRIFISLSIGILCFIIFNTVNEQLYLSSLITGVLFFLLVYILKLYGTLRKLSFRTFTYLFVTIFFLSLNGAYAIHHFNRKESIDSQFRFARNFLIDRDYFGEYLLGELSKRVSSDQFIQVRLATPFLSKDAIRQKIRQLFIPSYFNKYDVEIFVFNGSGEQVEGRTSISFQSMISLFDNDAFRTDYNGVYLINSPAADITQKYLVVVPVQQRASAIAGHVVIEFSLKKIIPENVYPELLVDNRFLQFYKANELSYAVFFNNDLSYSSGSYNYEGQFSKAWFGLPELHTSGITRNQYDHIAQEDDNGRVAVVSSRTPSLTMKLANFSFLLVLGLSTILVFITVQGLINVGQGEKLYFSTRIQLFLNLAFFLPLIIVSVMTLRVTNRSSQNQINDEYLSKTKKFSEQLSAVLHESLTTLFEGSTSFENNLTDLAVLSNVEANVYSASGRLFASSQPLIFENNLVSTYINPVAFEKIHNGENLFIEREEVGTLEYYTAFASLKAPSSGALIGVVSVPFFQSVYSLERVQINIVANILNIFAIVFVVLVGLSYFVTQWLTFPLTFITQTLKKTSLTKTNQPLVWKTDDEIGLMVKEYNQMLFSLSESKAELEQTQRERAWREIAQQVAHEIKNPLTPMKLTLQQLERSVQAGVVSPDKVQKGVSSLLTQVDTLNDIASSFSSFAKMPEPVIQPLELISLVRRIVDLHSHTGDIRFDTAHREIRVKGDEQLLGRTFSNIILNALQAALPGVPAVVWVKAEVKEGKALISFRDNGKGIEPEIAGQIFIPHFTTKKSGSGLGLAIARQAIEQMKGKLWFETVPQKGSVFYIELPLLH
jgi:two-component system, NtrC family, nitrogen regulation sensor histidine kinase NtrY